MNIKELYRLLLSNVLAGMLLLAITLVSCVDENELDFPIETNTTTYSESVALLSLLRAVANQQVTSTSDCIELFFPISLQYNNTLEIQVQNFDGLVEIANTNVSGQYTYAISFPFVVSKLGTIITVENESDFIRLLTGCEIITLRDEFDNYFTQCFSFTYPIHMVDKAGDTVSIGSDVAYFEFEAQQGFEVQPSFVYPLEVKKLSNNTPTHVINSFELFEVFDACSSCPQLFYVSDYLGGYDYRFTADFPEIDQSLTYDWYIDGTKAANDSITLISNNQLQRTFEAGTHEVCLKYQSLQNDCAAGTAYCKTIVVEEVCPSIGYEANMITANTYEFIANFPAKDEITYTWKVFLGNELIFSETEVPGVGDNRLEFQFDLATYTVCVEAEFANCPELVKYCQQFTIQ